jgi:hypothetical protein
METIDLTPNWQTSFAILTAALENGTDKGKAAAREELQRIGRQLDAAREQQARDAASSSPYSPELAEAFRQGARELQLDRLDVAADAIVEEGEGGAYVRCRVYVADGERLPMPGEQLDEPPADIRHAMEATLEAETARADRVGDCWLMTRAALDELAEALGYEDLAVPCEALGLPIVISDRLEAPGWALQTAAAPAPVCRLRGHHRGPCSSRCFPRS